MRALAPRFRGFPPAHRHVDDDEGDEVESRLAKEPVVGHRGASGRLLGRARQLVDRDEVFALSESGSIAEAIRARVRNLGTGYADAVVTMWAHLYTGGPSPVGALATANAERTWRDWFEAEGLAPQALGATREDRTPSPFASRPAVEAPTLPATGSRAWNEIDQAWADSQSRQHALVEAWRAAQMRELRRLWADGFQEGVGAFAEQYPELLTDDLLAEWDAEDEENADQLAPHYASIGKMVGQLTNLLMLAPSAGAITKWFDDNEHRVRSQAETLAWQAEQTGYRQAGANFGLTIEWESEGDDRVCDDCAALEEAGPYTAEDGDNPLPAFPGDGSTVCGPNCRCSLNYLEPDEPSLGQAEAIDQADAGDLVESSSEAVPGALGVEELNDLEGSSMVETFREIALRSRHRDIEIGFALDKKGRILTSALGNATSIDFTEAQLKKQEGAALVVHNHPLSVSFSPTDVAFAFTQGVGEMRVVSPLFDYSLKPVKSEIAGGLVGARVIEAAQEQVDVLYPKVKERATLAYHEQFKTPGAEHLSFAELFTRESSDFWHDVWTRTASKTKLFKYERTVAPTLKQMVHVEPVQVTKAHLESANLKPVGQLPLTFPKDETALLALEKDTGPSGANEGWWRKGKAGERYYIKPMSTQRAANEVGAMRVYEAAGAIPGKDIPYVSVINRVDDKPVVVSRFVEETVPKSASWWEHPAADLAKTDARRFWAVDSLLSHYDVVGANPAKGFDNLIARAGVGAFRVEGGGAMQFSGLGVQKAGWKVGAPWVEPWTMRGLAHDGVPGGATVKPVFGSISDEKAAELLGQLQHLDLSALDQAWKEIGMTNADRQANLNVIASRIAQIPTIQEQLGMVKTVAVKAAPAPPAHIASKVVYQKWNASSDKYGKVLAVQLKPFFEDFKKFNPVTGVASAIVENLAHGVTFPAYAIKQGEAKIARLKLRVAFARSYNSALKGDWQGMPASVAEFWKGKLSLVETTQAQVGAPHVVSTVVSKTAEHPPVHTIATALPKWDQVNDPLGVDFRAAHPEWYAELEKLPVPVQNAVVSFGAGSYSKGFALTYNDYLHGSPMLKAGAAPEVEKFWKGLLGDLPAQQESLQPVVTVTAHDAALKAAIAGPYDDEFLAAKEAISKGEDAEDALDELGSTLLGEPGSDVEPSDLISGLVKFGLAGDADSAANLVADWMAMANTIEKEMAPIEKGPVWLKPDADAFAQFKQDHPSGVGVPSLHDFEETYADWVAGGDQASWMPTPITKWFDANMVKPGELAPTAPTVENFNAAFPKSTNTPEQVGEWLAQWAKSVKDPGWGFAHLPTNVQAYLKSLGIKTDEQLGAASAKFAKASLQAEWETEMPGPFDVWYRAWKSGLPMEGDIGPITPQSPAGKWFVSHGISSGAPALNADQEYLKKVLEGSASDAAKAEDISHNTYYDMEQASLFVTVNNVLKAEASVGATEEELVQKLLASDVLHGLNTADEAKDMVAGWMALGIKGEGPDLAALKAAWPFNQPFESWYEAWTTGKASFGMEGPIKPDSPGGKFFISHGVASGVPAPATFVEYTTALPPGIEAVSVTKVDQLYGLLKADWPSMASSLSPGDLGKLITDYQVGKTNESWTAWFEQHAPEIQTTVKDVGQKEVAAVSFTPQTTLLAWSPTNDKWAKQFGKAHPKLYNSFKVFQAKPWVAEITKDLVFPAYAQKNGVKMARLRLKVALARTYNMAVQGKFAELGALDPKLPLFWKAKLGAMGMSVEQKVVGKVDASLANLTTTKELLRTTQAEWYPDFRGSFGHTVTMKIVPEFATTDIPIPANSTRERELRALAYAKSYLMAKAGDVAGLKAIDEKLLYFWDEKLGGGLAPKIAVSLEGAPWVHDVNALYSKTEGMRGDLDTVRAKYERSTRAADYKRFTSAIASFTASSYDELRQAAKSILRGGVSGRYGAMAKALIEAIQDAPATAPQLMRHESWASVASRAGTTREALESFFASKAGTDYAFTMDLVSTQYAGHWGGDLEWIIEPGAKAIFAQPLSSHYSENEFITAGRFKILRVSRSGDKLVVHVRQVGVFDLPD